MLPPRRYIAATPSANASDPNLVLGYQTHAPPAIQLVTTAATFAGLENARLGGGQSTVVIGKKAFCIINVAPKLTGYAETLLLLLNEES